MPEILYFFLPLVFIGIYPMVLFILSRLGWAGLSKRYAYNNPFEGKGLCISGARINWVNYNGVLSFKANEQGLYIVPIAIFKFFHPPVLIPWTAISKAKLQKILFIEQYKLSIGEDEFVKMTIRKSGFLEIKEHLVHLDKKGI